MSNTMQLKDLVGKNKSYISKINKDDLVNILYNGSRVRRSGGSKGDT